MEGNHRGVAIAVIALVVSILSATFSAIAAFAAYRQSQAAYLQARESSIQSAAACFQLVYLKAESRPRLILLDNVTLKTDKLTFLCGRIENAGNGDAVNCVISAYFKSVPDKKWWSKRVVVMKSHSILSDVEIPMDKTISIGGQDVSTIDYYKVEPIVVKCEYSRFDTNEYFSEEWTCVSPPVEQYETRPRIAIMQGGQLDFIKPSVTCKQLLNCGNEDALNCLLVAHFQALPGVRWWAKPVETMRVNSAIEAVEIPLDESLSVDGKEVPTAAYMKTHPLVINIEYAGKTSRKYFSEEVNLTIPKQ